ncbi:MAG TPA: DNRLRE domain-containing protein [Caproiciproducens sp.]|nr:DNRLRE domain-containing protein [Caproiciproducens sp.]
MPNVNLPSTFIASAAPASNFSTSSVIYVGTIAGLGSCTGLLQTANLPAGNPWVSAVLQLVIYTKSGSSPSTVNIQKVTAPSPLDVTTVTNSTPVTVDPTIQASRLIAASDIGTTIQIDLTDLINSWYATPFAGLALTCTDGSFVLFNSSGSADAAKRPQLILSGNPPPPPSVNVTIAGRFVDMATETVSVPSDDDATSTPRDISQRTKISFFVKNTGSITAAVGMEESVDGTNYITHPQIAIPPASTLVLTPSNYAKYARLYYHSNDFSLPTTFQINYIAQT